jgi:hypothetical protein
MERFGGETDPVNTHPIVCGPEEAHLMPVAGQSTNSACTSFVQW